VIRFLDGPASDVALALRRAPHFLRVVFNPRAKAESFDALDQLDDVPKPHERITVYVKSADRGRYHLKCSPRSASGFYISADYRLYDRQPDDATARDTAAWQAWCLAQGTADAKTGRVGGPRLHEPTAGGEK